MSTTIVATRAAADLAGMLLLGVLTVRGFAGLPVCRDAAGLVRPLAAAWVVAAGLNLISTAAQRTGIAPWRVDLAGLAAEARIVPAAALACVIAVVLVATGGRGPAPITVGLIVVGLTAGPATGHLGLSAVGAAVVTVHVLTASWWFGSLAAMPLLLRGRAEWSACLAAFSRWAPLAVALLGASGIAAALIRAPALDSRYTTLLLAKGCAFTLLLAVGQWQRRATVPRAHRRAPERTRRAIALEAVGLAGVTVLAAALSYAA